MSLALFCLASYGWALVLTQGHGPWAILARARAALRERAPILDPGRRAQTLLSCPMCAGIWVGLALSLALRIAERHPAIALPLDLVAHAGAAAGVAWAGVHLVDAAHRYPPTSATPKSRT